MRRDGVKGPNFMATGTDDSSRRDASSSASTSSSMRLRRLASRNPGCVLLLSIIDSSAWRPSIFFSKSVSSFFVMSETFPRRSTESACSMSDEDSILRYSNTEQSDSSAVNVEGENHMDCSRTVREFDLFLIVWKLSGDVSRLVGHYAGEDDRCSLQGLAPGTTYIFLRAGVAEVFLGDVRSGARKSLDEAFFVLGKQMGKSLFHISPKIVQRRDRLFICRFLSTRR